MSDKPLEGLSTDALLNAIAFYREGLAWPEMAEIRRRLDRLAKCEAIIRHGSEVAYPNGEPTDWSRVCDECAALEGK